MVSKASEDLPEPETPLTTVRALCGMSTSMDLRLWVRAPRMTMWSCAAASFAAPRWPADSEALRPRAGVPAGGAGAGFGTVFTAVIWSGIAIFHCPTDGGGLANGERRGYCPAPGGRDPRRGCCPKTAARSAVTARLTAKRRDYAHWSAIVCT